MGIFTTNISWIQPGASDKFGYIITQGSNYSYYFDYYFYPDWSNTLFYRQTTISPFTPPVIKYGSDYISTIRCWLKHLLRYIIGITKFGISFIIFNILSPKKQNLCFF